MNIMLDEALAKVDALLLDPEAETSPGLDRKPC